MMLVFIAIIILPFIGGVISNKPPKCEIVPKCPKGEHYTRNDPECRRTCENRMIPSTGLCKPFTGCVCNPGLVRLRADATGPCIPENLCRNKCRDRYAVFKNCPNQCPLTCAAPNPKPCDKMCIKSGCECAPGFVLNEVDGRCTRPWNCPEAKRCPKHSRYVVNYPTCQKTCGNRLLHGRDRAAACEPFTGCVCRPGYVRKYDNATGPCIPTRQCPPIPKKCGLNEQRTSCRVNCPPQTCESIYSSYYCLPTDCEPGCDCINGFLRNYNGECVPADDCFKEEPICGENEVETDCEIICPPQSCDSLFTTYLCIDTNCTAGCNCINGYLRNSLGICIPSDKCGTDSLACNGDLNATRVECDTACPATCAEAEPETCTDVCVLNGCQCKPGYILSERGGVCIAPKDCPGQTPICGANQTYVDCKVGCSDYCPTSDSRAQIACSIAEPCPSGCACKPGYLKLSYENPQCIAATDCPEVNCTRPNEVYQRKPTKCFSERCEDRGKACDPVFPATGRCVCKEGFFRNESDVCVPASECPNTSCNGDDNAVFSNCPSSCQATCANRNTNQPCNKMCMPPGCVCKPGFIKIEKDGKCIDPKNCPVDVGCKGDLNATYSGCTSRCPAKCADLNRTDVIVCTADCGPAGCVCKPGFILNDNGKCVKPKDCPAKPRCKDANAVFKECPSACEPTCSNRDTNQICIAMCKPAGCVCKPGFVLSEKDGKCVKPENCPVDVGCKGDLNATYSDCTSRCPAKCADLNRTDAIVCTADCGPGGCVCKPGFILNDNGKCVKPKDCPAKPRCNDVNAVFKECPSACEPTCSNRDTNQICIAMCKPAGCVCKPGFVLSEKEGKCVRPENCPEPTCDKATEVFSNCPSACQATCDNPDTNQPCIKKCMPSGCVCKPGFIRLQKSGKCIEPQYCPGGSPTCRANETYVGCDVGCPDNYCPKDDSLAIVACDPIFPCPGGCACKEGYWIHSEEDNRCILGSDCPPVICNRPNEVFSPNPPDCLHETCDNRKIPCDFPYRRRPSCICINGYFRNSDGICVPESECPKLECGYNEIEVPCHQKCPPQSCEIAYKEYICTKESQLCEPGCDCLPDHLRNASGICIPNLECPYPPPPTCGENEIARDCRRICPPQSCMSKYVSYRCFDNLPCEPGCDCIPNYLRDKDGTCIPSEKCPAPCHIRDACKPTCANPNPPDCEYFPPKENIDGCDCKVGFVLSELGGKCIPIEKCPTDLGCNGDLNAIIKQCPMPCPARCDSPNAFPCKRKCDPMGCQCKPGYILSNVTGKCILPDECPGGNPCGKNGRFVDCKTNCKSEYCPVDDKPKVSCDTAPDSCLPGCICNLNHKKKSVDNSTCIVASDCPPIKCTRPGEEYNSCPSACRREGCEDINNQPTVCNTLVLNCEPDCICKKGYFRNASGICIPAKDCPRRRRKNT